MDLSRSLDVIRIVSGKTEKVRDFVVREISLAIGVNKKELVTLQCSPGKLEYLAIGFLLSQDFIKDKKEIKRISLSEKNCCIEIDLKENFPDIGNFSYKGVIGSGCAGGITFLRNANLPGFALPKGEPRYFSRRILGLMKKFQNKSSTFKDTGGVHSCALGNQEDIEVFAEDIGRHNAVDKVFGECFLKDIPTEDKVIFTTGRISSEILIKVAKRKVPIIISRSAPTDLAIDLANNLNITLIGFARGSRINIYTHPYRIIGEE